MFKNMTLPEPSEREQIIARLNSSSQPFYLTGSRFFDGNTPQSDWDFFTDYNVDGFLESLGFHKMHFPAYRDSATVSVYRNPWHHVANIHVQVTGTFLRRKIRAQELLRVMWPFLDANVKENKTRRLELWNEALKLVQTETVYDKKGQSFQADFAYCSCGRLVICPTLDCTRGACPNDGKIVELNRHGWFFGDGTFEPFGPYSSEQEASDANNPNAK